MTKVFIIAVTPVLRAGLRALLADVGESSFPAITIVGEGASLDATWLDTALEPPDVLVVATGDELLPGDPLTALAGYATPPGLVVLSPEMARLAARMEVLPVRGWSIVPPEVSAVELAAAVEAAGQGMVALPRLLATGLFQNAQAGQANLAISALDEPLTLREQEILGLLGQGLSNKLIARQLQISEHTVKFHISSLFSKLDASSRADAVSKGARLGLITF